MSRYNGKFEYKVSTPSGQDANGYYTDPLVSDWLPGGDCHIEKHIPPKQTQGVDGVLTNYTYEVFIPKCGIELPLETPLKLIDEFGNTIDETKVNGFDGNNRKHIVVWA